MLALARFMYSAWVPTGMRGIVRIEAAPFTFLLLFPLISNRSRLLDEWHCRELMQCYGELCLLLRKRLRVMF